MAGKGAKRVSGLMETARRLNARAVLVSGLAAGAAFVAVLEADLRLTGRNVDDLVVLGRPLVKNRDDARKAGAAVHAVNSVALAALYTAIEKRLPGPPWVRGVIFANVENMILYPLTASPHGARGFPSGGPGRADRFVLHVAGVLAIGAAAHRLRRGAGCAVRSTGSAARGVPAKRLSRARRGPVGCLGSAGCPGFELMGYVACTEPSAWRDLGDAVPATWNRGRQVGIPYRSLPVARPRF